MPSRSAGPASVFGIVTRIVSTNIGRSIKKNASRSIRSFGSEDLSSISARSSMLALSGNCPRGRSARSACVFSRFVNAHICTLHAAARLFAADAGISSTG